MNRVNFKNKIIQSIFAAKVDYCYSGYKNKIGVGKKGLLLDSVEFPDPGRLQKQLETWGKQHGNPRGASFVN